MGRPPIRPMASGSIRGAAHVGPRSACAAGTFCVGPSRSLPASKGGVAPATRFRLDPVRFRKHGRGACSPRQRLLPHRQGPADFHAARRKPPAIRLERLSKAAMVALGGTRRAFGTCQARLNGQPAIIALSLAERLPVRAGLSRYSDAYTLLR